MMDRRLCREEAHAEAERMSWFQSAPDLSLKLIARLGLDQDTPIVDAGGGASALAGHLLDGGYRRLAVLDSAVSAIDGAKARLGDAADAIDWIVADVTAWKPTKAFGLWHDRAALQFLTHPAQQVAYAETVRSALAPEGWAIIAGVAPGGPIRCSGLDVVQHDAISLGRLFEDDLELMETHGETHATRWGGDQSFRYHLFRRRPAARREPA
jgi:hypothetical protein